MNVNLNYTLTDADYNEIDNNSFEFSNTIYPGNKIIFEGDISLTTSNHKHSASSIVNNIQLLNNDDVIGTIDVSERVFDGSMSTTNIPFSFSDIDSSKSVNNIKIDAGDDGLILQEYNINACNKNISQFIPETTSSDRWNRWIKNGSKTFSNTSLPFTECSSPEIDGTPKNFASGEAFFIITPESKSYLTGISFDYIASSVNDDFRYIIYGSNDTNYFNEIVNHGTLINNTDESINDTNIAYPKPFKYYKMIVTSQQGIHIKLSNIEPVFEEYNISNTYTTLFREQHFEHFTNKNSTQELLVPVIMTILFIGVLSLRK